MAANAVFIHHPAAERYELASEHPFNPIRLTAARHLLETAGALEPSSIVMPAPAGDELLQLVHRADYVQAVNRLSTSQPLAEAAAQAERYGLGTEDTPYFAGMNEAAAAIVGGSVHAADLVMSGSAKHAYHMAGGLHHAFPDRASGFCVYNDAAVAIAHIRKQYGARVLYIDTDVHHGDGVQWVFYADPDVCTYSIHETGKFLFPGTGFISERGMDAGFGMSVNVPMEPYTEDESWLDSFRLTLEKTAAMFKPDVIISQHGCDAHAFDPLSHIQCSMRIYQAMPSIIHQLAHTYTDGRWIAVGGGGYDIWRVVPRAWALVWLEMSDHPISARLNAEGGGNAPLPHAWRERWSDMSTEPLPDQWLDDLSTWQPMPRRAQIVQRNREITAQVLEQI
ncbi:acetoin utilization protein AcuC [Paenibacillus sp. R14(2021)]|uniref:acetoin utilization protein AcuC n=1 Tax=Paenibacillus sp. R14(2021) TaxID=2859228 RepID=UPI001C61583D|nr:acetoin utilization protein AcuC [Paenibacillus sp. R14(2021)]